MGYRLLDASCIIDAFDFGNTSKKIRQDNLLDKILKKEHFFYIPQFCVAEVFNTINKWCYRKTNDKVQISEEEAKILIDRFKDMIHDRKYLYAYDLHRYHNLNCDKIFKIENSTPKIDKKSYLSTFDILIIAMGIELQHIHGKDNFSIVSTDKRLVEVSKKININASFYVM